ncbi:MAG: LPXTG cell wall anchor domain-containing protein [Lachnospiraceae bacterium]|nr:LPXTG cell wall anchor domain-containing protein [Lachnospiraceae bacterium]
MPKRRTVPAGTYIIVDVTGYHPDENVCEGTAGEDGPYGLDEGTVYYVGTITVTAGSSLTYTAANTYSAGYTMSLTGGFGTWPYALAGLSLCGGAAAILCRRRRKA